MSERLQRYEIKEIQQRAEAHAEDVAVLIKEIGDLVFTLRKTQTDLDNAIEAARAEYLVRLSAERRHGSGTNVDVQALVKILENDCPPGASPRWHKALSDLTGHAQAEEAK